MPCENQREAQASRAGTPKGTRKASAPRHGWHGPTPAERHCQERSEPPRAPGVAAGMRTDAVETAQSAVSGGSPPRRASWQAAQRSSEGLAQLLNPSLGGTPPETKGSGKRVGRPEDRGSNKAELSPDYSRDEAWPSSTFADSRKKRVLPVANIDDKDVGCVEHTNNEQADLTQAGLMQKTDADLMRLHAEQMIGAAGAPSRVTAERRLRDSGLATPRRLLLPANSDIDSIVFGCDLDGSHTDDAAESNQIVKQYSGLGTRSSQQTNQMDMSRRSTNHMTLEQLYGSEVSGVPPRDPRDFGQARGISSRAISEHLVTSSDITRRPLGVGSSAVHPTQAAHAPCLPTYLPACLLLPAYSLTSSLLFRPPHAGRHGHLRL